MLESRIAPSAMRLRYDDSVIGFMRRGGFGVELAYRALA